MVVAGDRRGDTWAVGCRSVNRDPTAAMVARDGGRPALHGAGGRLGG